MTQEKPLVSLVFRVATAPWEIEQIHRLNYQAFVEEIPQHTPNSERRLVDKFHGQNTYVIGVANEPAAPQVVAMMALRAQRPFSLDQKLSNLDTYLPAGRKICEIRLLYIVPAFRRANVFRGLLETAGDYGMAQGWDLAIISGTTRQLRLYRHLGFIPWSAVPRPNSSRCTRHSKAFVSACNGSRCCSKGNSRALASCCPIPQWIAGDESSFLLLFSLYRSRARAKLSVGRSVPSHLTAIYPPTILNLPS
jgi:GNAT superfamily N-acetyltransferase